MNNPFKFRAEELQFVRLKLSADMADHSGVIRYLENIFSIMIRVGKELSSCATNSNFPTPISLNSDGVN